MKWYTPEMNDGKTVFVFGSNLAGRHGAGAAKDAALFWGAQRGVGNGPQGHAYAIPTKDGHLHTLSVARIRKFVSEFIDYAKEHPELRFLVTEVGCGLAGHTVYEMAPLFAGSPDNCTLPPDFKRIIKQHIDREKENK